MISHNCTYYLCQEPSVYLCSCTTVNFCTNHYQSQIFSHKERCPEEKLYRIKTKSFEKYFKLQTLYTGKLGEKNLAQLIVSLFRTEHQLFIESHTAVICNIKFCEVNKILATISSDYVIKVWKYSNQNNLYQTINQCLIPSRVDVQEYNLVISKYSDFIAISSREDGIVIWYYKERDRKVWLQHPDSIVTSVFLINSEKTLISVSLLFITEWDLDKLEPKIIYFYNKVTYLPYPILEQHHYKYREFVREVHSNNKFSYSAVSNDGKLVLVRKANLTNIEVYNLQQKTRTQILISIHNFPTSLALDSNGDSVAVGHRSGSILLCSLNSYLGERILSGHMQTVTKLVFTSDGSYLISGGFEDFILFWDIKHTSINRKLVLEYAGIKSLALIEKEDFLVVGSFDNKLKFINLNSEKVSFALGHSDWVSALDLSKSETKLVSGGHDRSVILWDLQSNDVFVIENAHKYCVCCLCFSNGEDFFVSGGINLLIKVWKMGSFEVIFQMEGHDLRCIQLDVSPDDKLVVSSSMDFTIRLWDLGNGKCQVARFGETLVRFERFSRTLRYWIAMQKTSFWVFRVCIAEKEII